MNAIQFKDVWEKYQVKFILEGKVSWEDFWALKGINFEIEKGEIVGLIGENGAGKTTTLKLIMGMLKPDRGEVRASGRVSGLLELGAGFQPELTGKENIYLNGSLFGLTKSQVDTKYGEIVDFAALGRFINAPVKCYSQGMFARLAFSIAMHVNPDILLIDDIFTVGDIYAQRKCVNKMFELKDKGMTIILISQDLEMLKKICSRGIFLKDGTVIKDGKIDRVCNYYMETVGKKEGVAIIEKRPLGIIFNNGKLILRWRDESITCNAGGHSSVLISGREYISSTADWQVESVAERGQIIAMATWPGIPIVQYWKISCLNDKEFLWEIIIQKQEDILIKNTDVRLLFTDGYEHWFTLDAKEFPFEMMPQVHESGEASGDAFVDKMIGIKGKSDSLPTVILDRLYDNSKMVCQPGNGNSEIGGRIIRYQGASLYNSVGDKHTCFTGKFMIFEPKEAKELNSYLIHTRQLIRDSTVLRKGLLSVFCKNNQIQIYWQDKLLTRGIGLNTKFSCQDKDYNAADGRWEITKKNNEEATIVISWADNPSFRQIWTLKLNADNAVLLEMGINISAKTKLRNKQTELMLSEQYENWVTVHEKGNFDKLEKIGHGVVLEKYITSSMGMGSVNKADSFFIPGVLFSSKDKTPRTSYISKINEGSSCVRLRYLEIDSKDNYYNEPGEYKYFQGEIRVGAGDINSAISRAPDSPAKLAIGRLSVLFSHGKGKICWKGLELTKGLGMYSSICSNGIWYDSSQAQWEVEKVGEESLIATGRWPWVPLIQTWEIRVLDENTVTWGITRQIWEEAPIDREQINIMLSGYYKEWFIARELKGRFPDKFAEHNGFSWDRLACIDNGLPMGTKKCKAQRNILSMRYLPPLLFSCLKDCRIRYSAIENTDNLFQGRVLQYDLGLNYEMVSNKSKYFEGQIKITP